MQDLAMCISVHFKISQVYKWCTPQYTQHRKRVWFLPTGHSTVSHSSYAGLHFCNLLLNQDSLTLKKYSVFSAQSPHTFLKLDLGA